MNTNTKLLILTCFIMSFVLPFSATHAQVVFDLKAAEEDPNYSIQKKQYLEDLYGFSSGVDIEALRYANEEKVKAYRNAKAKPPNTFANGKLIGEWFERGPDSEAGDIQDVDYDPVTNDLYALSIMGHIFKGNLDKRRWIPLNDQIRFDNSFIEHVKLPNGKDRLLALFGQGTDSKKIKYSDDLGKNWNTASGFDVLTRTNVLKRDGAEQPYRVFWDNANDRRLFELSDGTLVYIVASYIQGSSGLGFHVYHSTDFGSSFTKILSITGSGYNRNHVSLWKYPKSDLLFLYDLKTQKRYVINAIGGASQITGPQSLTGDAISSNGNDFNATGKISNTKEFHYINVGNKMYSSTNGIAWNLLGNNNTVDFWSKNRSFMANPNNNQIYGGHFQLYKATDANPLSWTEQQDPWWMHYNQSLPNRQDNLHPDITSIKYFEKSNGSPLFLIANHSGIHVSYDNMKTTQNLSMNGLNVTTLYGHNTAPDGSIYIGLQDRGIVKNISNNNGTTEMFGAENQTTGDGMYGLFFNGGNSYLGTLQNGQVLCRPDKNVQGGYGSWKKWNMPGNHKSGWLTIIAPHPKPLAKKFYLGGGNINGGNGSYLIEMKVDFNKSGNDFWIPKQFDYDFRSNSRNGSSVIRAISASEADLNRLYVATKDGTFFTSRDSGMSWNKSNYNIPKTLYPLRILVSKTNANKVFMCGTGTQNTGVYQSNNGGDSFSPLSNNAPNAIYHDIILSTDEKFLFAGTSSGPYVYAFDDNTWYFLGDAPAPNTEYRSVEYINDVVRFGTYGRGIWDFKLSETLSNNDILAENDKRIRVYPNPAKDYLKIDFDNVNGLQETRIILYDALGKTVLDQTKKLNFGKNTIRIELSFQSDGMYTLSFDIGDKRTITKKVALKN